MVTNVEIFENHKKEKKCTIFFDSKKVIESNCSTFLLEIFSWQWSLFAARVRTVMEWEKSGKKKKEPSTKLDPRYCQIYPRRFENP